jgi:hypothetical protein
MLTLDSYVTTKKKLICGCLDLDMIDLLVINFINSQWVPCHVTMGLFEATDMAKITMVM